MQDKIPTIRRHQINRTAAWKFFLSAPFIYGVFFPIVILDIFVEIYHQVCFRLYGLKLIPRNKYIFIDRQKLTNLHWIFKVHCMYCGYVNGFAAYFTAIAAETEAYWCAIKHEHKESLKHQQQQKQFLEREKFE
jgi:hypothetical protein